MPVYRAGTENFQVYQTGYAYLDDNLDDFNVTRKLSYLSLPLLFKYRVFNEVYFEAGPQFSLLAEGRDIFLAEDIGDGLTYETVITDDLNRLDMGFSSGIGFRLRDGEGMGIGVRYTMGFLDTLKDNGGKSQTNSVIAINFLVPVGGDETE